MANRFDNRSKAKFIKDIKECTTIERTLMAAYVNWLNTLLRSDEPKYSFADHGADNSGEFISGIPSTNADFLLKRSGKRDKKIDIKFARNLVQVFHLKIHQLVEYVQHDVCIINFIGIDTNRPKFCIIPPNDIAEWLSKGEKRIMWQKECIRFPVEELTWYELDKIKF